MPKMPGGDEKKEESAESKEEAAEQVLSLLQLALLLRLAVDIRDGFTNPWQQNYIDVFI